MEVCCEPAIFVKAKRGVGASHTTLHLTRLDQIRNYHYPSILLYHGAKGSCNGEQSHAEEQEWDDAAVLHAVRRGVEAAVEHYPWAAGRLRVVKQVHASQDGAEEELQECLQVCIDKDGGPGVQFVGARVNRPLHSLGDLSDPNPAFEPLFATVDQTAPYDSRPLVALQVSRFECGGFCVSMSTNHVLFDGFAASMFLQNMGSCARRRGLCLPLDLAPREVRIYPRNPPLPTLQCSLAYGNKKDLKPLRAKQALLSTQLVATKFVYTQHDIALLRSHALLKQKHCKRGFQACTRLQVITAHLWRAKARCMLGLHEDPLQEFPLSIGVNVRERVMTSIPKNYVGNAVGVVTPSASLKELSEKSLAFIVEIIQDAIKEMTMERFQSHVDYLEILGPNACVRPPSMVMPSLANLGFYNIDFGWGKPTHFGLHFKQAPNFVQILDGDAQCKSFNVFTAFTSEEEFLIFQNALKWELAH